MTYESARRFADGNQEDQNDHLDESAAEVQGEARDWDCKEDLENDPTGDSVAHYAAVPFRHGDIEEIELRSVMADMDHVFAHANRRQHRRNRDTVEQASQTNRRRSPANERFGRDAVEDHKFDRNRKLRAQRRDDYQ